MATTLRPSSRTRPCPVCGRTKDGDCRISSDGGLVLCHQNFDALSPGWVYLKPDKSGRCGVYVREDDGGRDGRRYRRHMDPNPEPRRAPCPPMPSAANVTKPLADPDAALKSWLAHGGKGMVPLSPHSPQARDWANRLGLPDPAVFEQIETGWLASDDTNRGELLAFPERDGGGAVIGYSRRYLDGTKRNVGRRGILIPRAITPTTRIHEGAAYLVEGASDVLALLAMGRNAIGRPSATGGVEHLLSFLRRLPAEWLDIVVVGENDRKDSGLWPGRDGAFRVAHRLAAEIGRPVRVLFPPSDAKDVRDWLQTEMKRCAKKPFRLSLAAYCAAGWDHHLWQHGKEVKPGDPSHDPGAPPSAAEGEPSSATPDLSDLSGERIGAAVERARQAQADASDPAAEERAAKESVDAMRRDFGRFPCPNTRKIVLRHRHTAEVWLIEVRCCKRRCQGCRAFLDAREMENAGVRFRTAVREGERIWQADCPREGWKRLYKSIRACAGEYLRVVTPGGYRVWTTATIGERVEIDAALSDLRGLLALYSGDRRPVATSHAWKLPRDESSGRFCRLGKGDPTLTAAKVLEIADATGFLPVLVATKRPNAVIRQMWRFERLRGDADEEALIDSLYVGEYIPDGAAEGGYCGTVREPVAAGFNPWDDAP